MQSISNEGLRCRVGLTYHKLLGISSIPVHLIYNSVIFKTLDTNNYNLLLVNEDFLKGEPFPASGNYMHSDTLHGPFRLGYGPTSHHSELSHIQEIFANNYKTSSIIQNLTNAECMRDYGVEYVSGTYRSPHEQVGSPHTVRYITSDSPQYAMSLMRYGNTEETHEILNPSGTVFQTDSTCSTLKLKISLF